MQEVSTPIGRNQFKCFQCRLVFAQRDGNWFDWDDMQVHLCKPCEKQIISKKKAPQHIGYAAYPLASGA